MEGGLSGAFTAGVAVSDVKTGKPFPLYPEGRRGSRMSCATRLANLATGDVHSQGDRDTRMGALISRLVLLKVGQARALTDWVWLLGSAK